MNEGTIASQLAELRKYARTQGYKVEEDLICTDDGVSGSHLARPGLDDLRDKIELGYISHVLVLTPDRLART